MKVHAALAKALIDNNIHTMFGVVGDGNLFMVDSFVREFGGTYIAASHEAGATLMANGYAAASGRLGVVTTTTGPGLTNTVTALTEAARNRVPLLLICGDTPVADLANVQSICQRDVVLPTGAGFEQVRTPQTAVADLAAAMRRSIVERRAMVLNVPSEFLWEEISYEARSISLAGYQAVSPDPDALDEALGIIASAKRPIVLGGIGAATEKGRTALARLAERIGAPVATTLKAKDLFRGDPADLGVFGSFSSPETVDAILESDCIVAFGASLNMWTTSSGAFLADKSVVQCDIDVNQLGIHYGATAGLVGDAATTADVIVNWLDEAEIEPTGFRTTILRRATAEPVLDVSMAPDSEADSLDLRDSILRLEEVLPQDRHLVIATGRYMGDPMKLMHVTDPGKFIATTNFGAIGVAMGTAIGAAFADDRRNVTLLCGDGDFMIGGLIEFNTAVRYGIDLIVIVCNDSSYGAENIQFGKRDMDPSLSMFTWPEFASVAESLGGTGVTISSTKDFEAAREAIASRNGPLLIDLKLDAAQMTKDWP